MVADPRGPFAKLAIHTQAIDLLKQHDWPGNVRELAHALERAFLVGSGHITADLLLAEMSGIAGNSLQPPANGDYQATMDRRATALFASLSRLVADQVYDGRYFDPSTTASLAAIKTLAQWATGTVTVDLYKGHVLFHSLTDCPHSIYNEEDSSMEASQGLNPVSSQGFAEIQSVEAHALAHAGQIRV